MLSLVVVVELEDLPAWTRRLHADVYLPRAIRADSVCVVAVEDRRDWTDEQLDDPALFPKEARERRLWIRLEMSFVDQVIANATEQLGSEPTPEVFARCLQHFVDHDAFAELESRAE